MSWKDMENLDRIEKMENEDIATVRQAYVDGILTMRQMREMLGDERLVGDSKMALVGKKILEHGRRYLRDTRQFLLTASVVGLGAMIGAERVEQHRAEKEKKMAAVQEEMLEDVPPVPVDRETKDILNYLSGKEPLSNNDCAFFFREFVKMDAESEDGVFDFSLPENFDSFTFRQLQTFVMENPEGMGIEAGYFKRPEDVGIRELVDLLFTQAKFEYQPAVYKALWKMEEDMGAPKIRWLVKSDMRDETQYLPGEYSPEEHTIYISPIENGMKSKGISNLMSEFAHADQYANKPFETELKDFDEQARITMKTLLGQQEYWEAQDEEYDLKGSLEYEAHEEIEPQLREKMSELVKKSGGDDVDWYSME